MTMTNEEATKHLKEWREVISSGQRKAVIDMAIEALSAEAVQYTEWLEKIIVDAESFEWICDDATVDEWCEKNCRYASIQAECLRHLYAVSKGGESKQSGGRCYE